MHTATPRRRVFFKLAIACVAALVMPAFAAAQPAGEWDGLVLQPSSAVDLLYVRPEASLAGYRSRSTRIGIPTARDTARVV